MLVRPADSGNSRQLDAIVEAAGRNKFDADKENRKLKLCIKVFKSRYLLI